MIQVRHACKSFGGRAAVRDLSFDAPDRAITGLLGANSAGKTTTLRMIAGVLPPDRGTIRLDGLSVTDDSSGAQRLRGALLDHQGLYGRMTAREHLVYFAQLRGLAGTALHDRVERLLETLGMSSVANRRAAGFSQGERLKVALGCAMIHSPRHLLLDEPTNGLDVPTVRALRTLLRRLRDEGACIVFSSHVLSEVDALCDRIVVVTAGSVVAEGTPDEIKRRSGDATLEDAFVKVTQTEVAS